MGGGLSVPSQNGFLFGSQLYPSHVNFVTPTNTFERYLGIFFNAKLSFEEFFSIYIAKMSRGLFYLIQNKKVLPIELMLLIYFAHIHSHLEFISMYLNLASTKTRKKIVNIQKRAIRTICGLGFNGHTAEHFKNLDILPVSILSKFNIFRFIKHIKNSDMNELFKTFWPTHKEANVRHSPRTESFIYLPRVKRKRIENLPYFNFPDTYNKILACSEGLEMHEIREFLLESYCEKNSCSVVSCYVCKKAKDEFPAILKKREDKINRVKELIKAKSAKKNERFERLYEKLGQPMDIFAEIDRFERRLAS